MRGPPSRLMLLRPGFNLVKVTARFLNAELRCVAFHI
jgi:hypothetical protein